MIYNALLWIIWPIFLLGLTYETIRGVATAYEKYKWGRP